MEILEDKYGLWTVIDKTPIKHGIGRVSFYKVQCACGKIEEKSLAHLRAAKKTNSGCISCRFSRNPKVKVGNIYKGWQVLSYTERSTKRGLLFLCECLECHKQFELYTNQILSTTTSFHCKSCSDKLKGIRTRLQNGAVGELTAERVSKIKNGAYNRKIHYDLSIKYLWDLYEKQNRRCAITGDLLQDINKASLDRIDSSKGYVKGNVQWVTIQANIAKHTLNIHELYALAKKIVIKYEHDYNL